MESWLQHYWIELAGTIFAIIYLSLSIRENIWLWPVGFLTSFFYLIVFFQSRLYADMGLQFYYLVVSVYGWFHWLGQRNKGVLVKTVLPTVSITKLEWIVYLLAIGILIIFIYLALIFLPGLLNLPPSDLPLGDAFTTAASIVATWMLARKILENWLIWIVVNAFSLGMYAYKGLHITVFLFVIYTAMSVVGYYRWKTHMQQEPAIKV